ncbi:DUF6801 domain-containing protein [Allokutzneria sp. NRRL B-24872]|uniref:DUF6801 domain-containing protein n=1 Tax=Allokutzneria sp. NRRL B-24872 TaxID=1137961 RepID=UPI0011783777|nr:DUF6801 domain-containing protein [Allokutzneria sp. NRRL B-24872]
MNRRVMAFGVVAGFGAALFGIGGGVAVAGPVSTTLTYSCDFPLIGPYDVSTKIDVTLPDSGTVGQPVQATDLKVTVTVPEDVVAALAIFEAATVAGSATAGAVVTDSAGQAQDLALSLNVPSVVIPPTGPLPVLALGAVPPATVATAGTAKVSVAPTYNATLTPRKADGSETDLGTFDLPCTASPATQDRTLGTIPIASAVR